MNITTNQNQLRPNVPGFFTLVVSQPGFDDITVDVNKAGDIVRHDVGPATMSLVELRLRPVILEILAGIRKSFTWFTHCETALGAQLDHPDVMLRQPIGHWCIADAKARTVVLRENRSLIDTKAVGFSA